MQIMKNTGTPRKEDGSSILLALFVVLLGSSMIIVGLTLLMTTRDAIVHELHLRGRATAVAEAGLTDALYWFRRQNTQPVQTFTPILDPENNIYDTDEPDIGIVREIEISPQTDLFGRYEVMKVDPLTAEPVVHDISAQRAADAGFVSAGTCWYLESRGMVFEKNDPTKAYNELPNRVIRRVTLAREISRLPIAPTAQAALISDVGHVEIDTGARLRGFDNLAMVWDKQGGGTTTTNRGEVDGPTAWASVFAGEADDFSALVARVFATTPEELQNMADIYATSVDQLPTEMPALSIIYIDGDATFTSARPLYGGGALVVNGNMTISSNSASYYSGLVLISGDFTQLSPSLISGTVIVLGDTYMAGSMEMSEIIYEDDILNVVRQKLGQYRFSRSPYHAPDRGGI
jgi:hypothetical protein